MPGIQQREPWKPAGQTSININKKERVVKADIDRTDAFSAHADTNGLLNYYKGMDLDNVKKLFFVHGDEGSMHMLESKVSEQFPNVETVMPEKGMSYELD